MIAYVRGFIEAQDPIATKLTARFPFRRRADHCYRTYRWAQRIHECEGGDKEIIEISALFHDIGQCIDNTAQGHARVGANICERYLLSRGFDADKTARIVRIVRSHVHSVRDPNMPLEAKIVRDADLLDEVGALTVLWDAMAAGAEDEQSYTITYGRICAAYRRLKGRDLGCLETETGKRFYRERVDLMGQFVRHLEYELGLSSAF